MCLEWFCLKKKELVSFKRRQDDVKNPGHVIPYARAEYFLIAVSALNFYVGLFLYHTDRVYLMVLCRCRKILWVKKWNVLP